MRRFVLALALGAVALVGAREAPALEITHVSHLPEVVNPNKREHVRVRFHLSEAARVRLNIYDARDLLVRTVSSTGVLEQGDQALLWDGRDDRGRQVPTEAYVYTLEAESEDGRIASWDISDFSGESVDVSEISWDGEHERVAYRLARKARVRVRIGLANDGPLLRTLIDWVPRPPGRNEEPWDGRDATRAVDLSEHPGVVIEVNAFALPRNAVLVGAPPVSNYLDLPRDTSRRQRRASGPHRMFDASRRGPEERGDYTLALILPRGVERNADGVAVVSEPIPIRVEVPERDFERVLNQRSEIVFYVDGRFVMERETGFLPATWVWDPTGHAPGLHHLTANVRGYEGDFGTATLPVWVERSADSGR